MHRSALVVCDTSSRCGELRAAQPGEGLCARARRTRGSQNRASIDRATSAAWPNCGRASLSWPPRRRGSPARTSITCPLIRRVGLRQCHRPSGLTVSDLVRSEPLVDVGGVSLHEQSHTIAVVAAHAGSRTEKPISVVERMSCAGQSCEGRATNLLAPEATSRNCSGVFRQHTDSSDARATATDEGHGSRSCVATDLARSGPSLPRRSGPDRSKSQARRH
jgi:hypothetical protein